MPVCINVEAWRASTPDELAAYYSKIPTTRRPRTKSSASLIVRTHLRPADIYSYLRARFGKPNGFQNYLRKNDSDNLIHWDFNLKCVDVDIYISGWSREIHFLISEHLGDADWQSLILAIKADFGRVSRAKGEMMRSFEKFLVFPNKFAALANYCSHLHARIVDAPPYEPYFPSARTKRGLKASMRARKRASNRANTVYGDSLTLALLTPIMAEAFLNMMILTLRKEDLRSDPERYAAFLKEKIPERLALLPQNCFGFTGEVDRTTDAYRAFMRVINKRNFAVHGNVDPVREQMETVYFEGKRPLFAESGDHMMHFFEKLERLHTPVAVVQDYEGVHAFLHELTTYLEPRVQAFFEQVISDNYPGYEVKAKRVTRVLPDHLVMMFYEKARYDDELKVQW